MLPVNTTGEAHDLLYMEVTLTIDTFTNDSPLVWWKKKILWTCRKVVFHFRHCGEEKTMLKVKITHQKMPAVLILFAHTFNKACIISLWCLTVFRSDYFEAPPPLPSLGTKSHTPTPSIYLCLSKHPTCDTESMLRIKEKGFPLPDLWQHFARFLKEERETERMRHLWLSLECLLVCVRCHQPARAKARWPSQPPEELWTRNANFGALPEIIS